MSDIKEKTITTVVPYKTTKCNCGSKLNIYFLTIPNTLLKTITRFTLTINDRLSDLSYPNGVCQCSYFIFYLLGESKTTKSESSNSSVIEVTKICIDEKALNWINEYWTIDTINYVKQGKKDV